jgi:cell division protein FtsB
MSGVISKAKLLERVKHLPNGFGALETVSVRHFIQEIESGTFDIQTDATSRRIVALHQELAEKEAEVERLKARVSDLEDAKGDYFDNEPDTSKKLNQAAEALNRVRGKAQFESSRFAWDVYEIADKALQSIKGAES